MVTLEAQGRRALTGDYLRVNVNMNVNMNMNADVNMNVNADVDVDVEWDVAGAGADAFRRLHSGVLRGNGDDLYIELALAGTLTRAASGMESPSCSHVSSA